MRIETAKLLRAPDSRSALELESFETAGDDVIAGRLIEKDTGMWFRIENGIADLVPLEYRNAARYESFCRTHRLEHSPAPHGRGQKDSNTEKQISFFAEYGEGYEADVVESPFYKAFDQVTIGRWIDRNITGGLRIVEVGCGTGRQTVPLLKAGAHVVGVDLSEELLRAARRKILSGGYPRKADFVAGIGEKLPLCDAAFDAGVIFGSLHHFSDPPAALLGIARAVKPKGHFYLMEPHKSPVRFIFDWIMRRWTLWEEDANEDPLFTAEQFQRWLGAGGFTAEIGIDHVGRPYVRSAVFFKLRRNAINSHSIQTTSFGPTLDSPA